VILHGLEEIVKQASGIVPMKYIRAKMENFPIQFILQLFTFESHAAISLV